jgi:diguanylate cyclase (GGDEF)-like protein
VLVVSDNAAFDFALRWRSRLFPNVPIVFCGVNDLRPEQLAGLRNLTGVNESIDIAAAVERALQVQPGRRTLAFVTSTDDLSSQHNAEALERFLGPRVREQHQVVVLKNLTSPELRRQLGALPPDTLVFILGQTRDKGAGRVLTAAEHAALISAASPLPVYTFWDVQLGTGVLGGHVLRGIDQGRAAGAMVLQILDGHVADTIPVQMVAPARDVFDYQVMQRHGISQAQLPPGSEIINRPFSIWQDYRQELIGALLLLLLQTLLIGLLVRSILGRRRAILALAHERAHLESRVRERTLELEQVNAKLARISLTDGLTGLANRRHFNEVLEREFARLQRSGGTLSLLMLDVDYFKPYNDTYGHVAGDECLQQVGQLIQRCMLPQSGGLAARYGGEEFAVILPDAELAAARALAESINAGVAYLGIAHRGSAVAAHVTVSVGVVTLQPVLYGSANQVIAQADAQLYLAKSGGRNRVLCATAAPHVEPGAVPAAPSTVMPPQRPATPPLALL